FRILGFHSDNGSEFINRIVARLLNKLLIAQTKSRPRHSNDNGLAETKKGAAAASTAAIRRPWKPCWPCPTRRSTCAPDSPPPSYNALPEPAATPKPRSSCNRRNADSLPPCRHRLQGRGNDGRQKSPTPRAGIFLFLGKRKKTKARFPHFHRPGCGC